MQKVVPFAWQMELFWCLHCRFGQCDGSGHKKVNQSRRGWFPSKLNVCPCVCRSQEKTHSHRVTKQYTASTKVIASTPYRDRGWNRSEKRSGQERFGFHC